MAQFYTPFIPHLSRSLVSLYDMLKAKRSSHSILKWTPTLVETFHAAKHCLANYTALAFPVSDVKILLVTDASMNCYTTGNRWHHSTIGIFFHEFTHALNVNILRLIENQPL